MPWSLTTVAVLPRLEQRREFPRHSCARERSVRDQREALLRADDLIFSEPAAFHLWSYLLGQCLSQTGLGGEGNVNISICIIKITGYFIYAGYFLNIQ